MSIKVDWGTLPMGLITMKPKGKHGVPKKAPRCKLDIVEVN
jgi:hypothetical protein